MTTQVWDDDARCFLTVEALEFTGPCATVSLLPGEGREQRHRPVAAAGAKRSELIGRKDLQASKAPKRCRCGAALEGRTPRCPRGCGWHITRPWVHRYVRRKSVAA